MNCVINCESLEVYVLSFQSTALVKEIKLVQPLPKRAHWVTELLSSGNVTSNE